MRDRKIAEDHIAQHEADIAALRRQIENLEAAIVSWRNQLDGFCRAKCDHGHGCSLPRHHDGDRHETADCVFYDVRPS